MYTKSVIINIDMIHEPPFTWIDGQLDRYQLCLVGWYDWLVNFWVGPFDRLFSPLYSLFVTFVGSSGHRLETKTTMQKQCEFFPCGRTRQFQEVGLNSTIHEYSSANIRYQTRSVRFGGQLVWSKAKLILVNFVTWESGRKLRRIRRRLRSEIGESDYQRRLWQESS